MTRTTQKDRGFTFIEFLVAMAILGLILASVIPFILSKREMSRRIACADNLRAIRGAMGAYLNAYESYPRTRFNNGLLSWTAYSGADDANPFAPDSQVQPNDTTAAMWLLVREGYVTPDGFICPSSGAVTDPVTSNLGQRVEPKLRGNFRSKKNLSYSILMPYNPSSRFVWDDTLPADSALMADMNPGVTGSRDDVTRPNPNSAPEDQAAANSNNHAKVGQNVLYTDGSVEFHAFAYCGSGLEIDKKKGVAIKPGDNIYSSFLTAPNSPGAFGKNVGPSWDYDSYLLPSDDE